LQESQLPLFQVQGGWRVGAAVHAKLCECLSRNAAATQQGKRLENATYFQNIKSKIR
jgi:hypothetical protein